MEKIGKYEIVRKIAEGNFSSLFEGKEPSPPDGLGRRVALKLCSANDEQLRQRFGIEVELIAQLGHHPNIAAAYDIGYLEGAPFLVEEYLPGEDLRHKIDRKDELPPVTKIGWLLQVAKGLKFAHSKEIVHRDIKPENVRISPTGHVKIIDFGIGKAVSSEATRLTMDGTIMGTLGYLAPEQLRGKADLRSDIFSFGVMAYEFLTYHHPFTANTLREQFRVLMEDEPVPMSKLWPECPPGLTKVVSGCLEKELAKRTQTFDAVVEGLRTELRNLEMAPEPAAPAPDSAAGATFILDKDQLQALTEGQPVEVKTDKTDAKPEAAPPPPPEPEKKADLPKAAKEPEKEKTEAKPKPTPAPPPPPAPEEKAPARKPEQKAEKPAKKDKPPVEKKPGARKPSEKKPPLDKAAAAKPSGLPKWILIAAGGIVILGLVGFFVFGRSKERPAAPASEAVVTEPRSVEIVAAETGSLTVNAYPWGEVRLEDASQATVTLPEAPCTTPCTVELEPGTYTAFVVNPAFPEIELTCEASIAASMAGVCHVVFGEPTATDFFKAAGWWR